jgi:hypothetical protein
MVEARKVKSARAAAAREALGHRGMHALAQVARAMEGVHVQAVAHLARDAAHPRVHPGQVHRDARMVDRPRVEERRHEIESIRTALEAQRGAVLPAIPDRPQGSHDLTHARARRLPRDREAPLIVRLHLRAEAHDEAAARSLLQIPAGVSQDHRAARKRQRDGGAEADPRGCAGRDRQRQERVVPRLGRPDRAEAQVLGPARVFGHGRQVERHQSDVEPHVPFSR